MLINQEWSAPKKVAYGKNITLQFSKPGFSVKVFSDNGSLYEKQVLDGKEYEIRASEISAIAHPMISLKTEMNTEIHVHIDCPLY
jgi:hypothetical protein